MSKIVPVVAVGVLLLAGALAVGYAGGEAGQRYAVDNETWTADPGNTTTLDESNVANASYDSSVAVYDGNCGGDGSLDGGDGECKQLRPGEDYVWNTENGTVRATENGSLDDGEEAIIRYAYGVPTAQQQALIGFFATGYEFAAPLVLILMVGVGLGSLLRFVS